MKAKCCIILLILCASIDCLAFAPGNNIPISRTYSHIISELHDKKWSPRWNPAPDSDYYKRGDGHEDIYGGVIYSGKNRRNKRSKFIPRYRKFEFLSIQKVLVAVNIACFIQQVNSSIQYLPQLNSVLRRISFPFELPITKLDILEDMLLGMRPPIMVAAKAIPSLGSKLRIYGQSHTVATSLGPFTMDFVNQRILTRLQPHRYITSGFLHANMIHLLFNMRYLWTLPRWLEDNGGTGNGLGGWLLYLTVYLLSIIIGNIASDYFLTSGVTFTTLCLGASGGICGLNGLLCALFYKMGNNRDCIDVFKNMGFLLLFGYLMEGVSNSSHVAGFVTGIIMGFLFGPTYSLKSTKYRILTDEDPLDYRVAMGSGLSPDAPFVPLRYLFGALSMIFFLKPEIRNIPSYIFKGVTEPGLLSGLI